LYRRRVPILKVGESAARLANSQEDTRPAHVLDRQQGTSDLNLSVTLTCACRTSCSERQSCLVTHGTPTRLSQGRSHRSRCGDGPKQGGHIRICRAASSKHQVRRLPSVRRWQVGRDNLSDQDVVRWRRPTAPPYDYSTLDWPQPSVPPTEAECPRCRLCTEALLQTRRRLGRP